MKNEVRQGFKKCDTIGIPVPVS